jgi:nucleoside-diphosphate-sugar epimerase
MPIIAVAGGAGQLGRAIVDALHAAGSSVIILGRQVRSGAKYQLFYSLQTTK